MTMGNSLQLSQILLMLMLPVFVTQAIFIQNIFKKLQLEQSIIGTTGTELVSGSHQECARRCLSNQECKGYQYKGVKENNCRLILRSCGAADRQEFQQNVSSHIYEIEFAGKIIWNKPCGWTGPEPALYQSFDTSVGLTSFEGTIQMSEIPLISGKVNKALTLNHTNTQWVDLGIHTEACMTQSDTCGAAGGAISLWLKLLDSPSPSGIISSWGYDSTGSMINFETGNLWFGVFLSDGYFFVSHPKPTGWTHVLLNYIGPNNGEGIRIFIDGTEVANDTTKVSGSRSAGNGRIVVGRILTDTDGYYPSLEVDEVIFFNSTLVKNDIVVLATTV